MHSRRLRVEIVIPVFNEAHVLTNTVRTVVAFLSRTCPYDWHMVIADNRSTDATPEVIRCITAGNPRVLGLRIETQGRGIALRRAWADPTVDIHAYMDADLSTDLGALGPLLAHVADGCDIAIGSRHVPNAALTRGLRRDMLSRGYNALLRLVFGTGITDAQCGFKAVSHRVVTEILPHVQSDGWFFDTELLLLAERAGYKIAQVPVMWVEDRDSRVNLRRTVIEYLRGVWRLRYRGHSSTPRSARETVARPSRTRRASA
ncbi:MAG TPA: glycosyltransferase [bacterium]|nr:glycosyltransferase [bacterium]